MAEAAFNIHQAKTHLSRLLQRVVAGDEIVIAKAGKPIARLVPFNATRALDRTLGNLENVRHANIRRQQLQEAGLYARISATDGIDVAQDWDESWEAPECSDGD